MDHRNRAKESESQGEQGEPLHALRVTSVSLLLLLISTSFSIISSLTVSLLFPLFIFASNCPFLLLIFREKIDFFDTSLRLLCTTSSAIKWVDLQKFQEIRKFIFNHFLNSVYFTKHMHVPQY